MRDLTAPDILGGEKSWTDHQNCGSGFAEAVLDLVFPIRANLNACVRPDVDNVAALEDCQMQLEEFEPVGILVAVADEEFFSCDHRRFILCQRRQPRTARLVV